MKSISFVLLFLLIAASGCAPDAVPPVSDISAARPGYQVGNLTPDIQGTDANGEEFKLSDYSGKVIMLDFWGDW